MKTAPKGGGGSNDFQSPGRPGNHSNRNTESVAPATTSPGRLRVSRHWWWSR